MRRCDGPRVRHVSSEDTREPLIMIDRTIRDGVTVLEMRRDPAFRIGRPRQVYMGAAKRPVPEKR